MVLFNPKRFVGALLCIIFSGQCVLGQSKAQRIDSLLRAVHAEGLFNGVALVSDSGKVIHHKAYGLADRESDTPLSLDNRFYIGSLTKPFTAVLILQLQEAGSLNINQPISTYLPEFQDSIWTGITVHHLLSHTSGMGSYTSHSKFDKGVDYSEEEMIGFIKHPLLFHPGEGWSYSNSGYYLLGKIAERATGEDFGSLLHERIFSVVGMNNTGFSTEWLDENVALGYWQTVNGYAPRPAYSMSSLFSTGGMYSTATDLFKWDQALYGNKLLSDSSKQILFNPVRHDYACGWYVKKATDEDGGIYERHFHGGWIKGYHAFMLRRIPPNQAVILLDNSYSQEIQTIKNRIWSALIDEHIRPIKPKLSNLLFRTCAKGSLSNTVDSISDNQSFYEERYEFEEFDINTVGYRLMEAGRSSEAEMIFQFNISRYPESWNVYDSMGELKLKLGELEEAKQLYEKSLALNPESTSAQEALRRISESYK